MRHDKEGWTTAQRLLVRWDGESSAGLADCGLKETRAVKMVLLKSILRLETECSVPCQCLALSLKPLKPKYTTIHEWKMT
jgi:hypothetical protein